MKIKYQILIELNEVIHCHWCHFVKRIQLEGHADIYICDLKVTDVSHIKSGKPDWCPLTEVQEQ